MFLFGSIVSCHISSRIMSLSVATYLVPRVIQDQRYLHLVGHLNYLKEIPSKWSLLRVLVPLTLFGVNWAGQGLSLISVESSK